MKRIFPVLLIFVLLGTLTIPVSAKDAAAVVKELQREPQLAEDLYVLCEVVDAGDGAKIFQVVLERYQNLIAMIKAHQNEDVTGNVTVSSAAGQGNPRYLKAVKALLRSQVFFDDMAKLNEVVATGDGNKIFLAIMEQYPDYVAGLKRGMEEADVSQTASILTTGTGAALCLIGAAAVGAAVGGAAVYAVMKKKKSE